MSEVAFKAEKRTVSGTKAARRLRREKIVPAVLYSEGGNCNIQLDETSFEYMLGQHASEHLMVALELDGKTVHALLKEVQHHPITAEVVHADFQEVDMNKPVHVEVPVELIGEAAGVKAGGVLEALHHTIEIECLPMDLPEVIEVDVSGLQVGDTLTVGELTLDSKLKVLTAGDIGVAGIVAPTVEVEPVEEGAEEAAAE